MSNDDLNPDTTPDEAISGDSSSEAPPADALEAQAAGDDPAAATMGEPGGEDVIGAADPAGAQEPAAAGEPPPTSVDFGELVDALPGSDPQSLSVLFDLSLPVAIELGRTRMSVQDVLSLGRGSVVQLDRLAGEPVDVFVGDRRFAEGEVVVLGEQFGVRITRIVAGAIPGAHAASS